MLSGASVLTEDLSHYPHVPYAYILSRTVSAEQEQAVHDATRITPLYFGIVTDPLDYPLASRFAQVVMQVADDRAAKVLALQLYNTAEGHPSRSVIIGNANILIGIYEDREANIPC